MYPVLFKLFGYNVYASPVFLALAIVAAILVGKKEVERRGLLTPRDFTLYWTLAIPIALLLAMLNSSMFRVRITDALNDPRDLFSNGYVSFGAVLGLLGWGFIFAKIRKIPAAPILDTISFILPLTLGIYRIGCILNGCCYGLITSGAAGLNLPDVHGNWADRYPTQLLLLIFDFGLFAMFWKWRLKNPRGGRMTYVFLFSFSIFRLLVDGLRDLPAAYGPFSLHQIASLAILLVTLSFMFESRLEQKPLKS